MKITITQNHLNYKYSFKAAFIAMAIILVFMFIPMHSYAADNGIPDDYEGPFYNNIPHVQLRNVFETETVEVSGIKVLVKNEEYFNNEEDTIHFRIFNTTTQETECEVDTIRQGGVNYLPPMQLKKNHDYIFFVEDRFYRSLRSNRYPAESKAYVQVLDGSTSQATDGSGAYDYMTNSLFYNKLQEIRVEKRESVCEDPFDDNRFDTGTGISVKYKGKQVSGVKFRLVSDVETLETTVGTDAKFKARLIEGVTYMLYVDSDKYSVDSFPIVAKDKSEYNEGLYCYNHTNCIEVKEINLYDKNEMTFDGNERVTSVNSLKDRSTVSGINFKNQLIIDRILESKIEDLEGKPYELISLTAINPRRWEISKLTGADFSVKWKRANGRLVKQVYILDANNSLRKISFKQSNANDVSFNITSLSTYPVAIEYDNNRGYADYQAELKRQADERKKTEEEKLEWEGKVNATIPVAKGIKTKAGKKKLTVSWKKLSKKQLKKFNTIEIQVCENKSFLKNETIRKNIKKSKKTQKINIKKKGTYYVRVRNVKGSGTNKIVSKWSKTKKIKIK